MTRARTKKAQEALKQLLNSITEEEPKKVEGRMVNYFSIQEDPCDGPKWSAHDEGPN